METKIIKAVFGGGTSTVTNKRTRTDYGQVLEIIGIDLPDTFECIFSNSATSAGVGKKQIGSSQRVLIPDEYLATGQPIYAWILLHDTEDDGRHMYSIRIPVADMPDTSPAEPTPVEQSVISQAITALNSAVTTTTQKAQEATESADRAEQAAEGVEGYVERAEAAQNASESARDIALEAKVSAQASAATASEKASEAISSATTASQSALTAESASESASASADASYQNAQTAYRYAQDSATSAGQAESYASGAGIYASDAQTYSQTASQKASEAAQSASTAVQAKTDAETAKTASETAHGLAESARDEAVSAKTGAESARDEAQSIADGITGKVEQIDSNTERIESLEDDRYKPYSTDTASGAVASFPDGADGIPLKSCIVQVNPVQEGSGDPSPDNIRPITGWTGCEVQRTGINIFGGESFKDAVLANISIATAGEDENGKYVSFTAGAASNEKVLFEYPWKENTVYTFIYRYRKNNTNAMTNLAVYYKDGTYNYLSKSGGVEADTVYTEVLKSSKNKLISHIRAIWGSGTATIYYDDFGVFEGDITATDFAPYTGQTYPITFPSEAGTVYGAHIDVTGGELVNSMASMTLNASTGFSVYASGANTTVFRRRNAVPSGTAIEVNQIANMLRFSTTAYIASDDDANTFVVGPSGSLFLQLSNSIANTVEQLDTFLRDTPLVVFYNTNTTQTYSLTPTEIKTLLGTNNIWCNTGDTEVEYRADTRLYIEKLTQPEEYDMIADSNITNGSYFMVGNDLYLATATIASGASVIEGTNATKVSLAQALNAINA